jgi:hypothetical protein
MSANDARRLVLVVGVGRSGTSLFTGILGQLGFHVPQPEVKADQTNPRGFSEPRWVVDFHTRLLRKRRVMVNDARPGAWEKTAAVAEDEAVQAELRQWLKEQLDLAASVVVKDPRTSWFLPLWTRCATEVGVEARYATMLRYPPEVLRSASNAYGTWLTPANRAAGWINVTLETERLTRGSRRVFLRNDDVLADWARELSRVGQRMEVPTLEGDLRASHPAVDDFVDPGLHRNQVTWDEVEVPARVRELGERVWADVQRLALPDGDSPQTHARLDALRDEYQAFYAEAEAIAQSSIVTHRPRKKPQPPKTLRARIARRLPAPVRRRLRGS